MPTICKTAMSQPSLRQPHCFLLIALLTTASCSDPDKFTSPRDYTKSTINTRSVDKAESNQVLARIQANADPRQDAAKAITRGDFRLFTMNGIGGGGYPSGVICYTPHLQAPRVLAGYFYGDVIDERASKFENYATTYNTLIVNNPNYPDADLCRQEDAALDNKLDRDALLRLPARTVESAPQSLHEAARRGTRADVLRFIQSGDLNAVDGTGMTPLAWAVVRKNSNAIAMLIDAGADPWIDGEGNGSAIYWSALFGEPAIFDRLIAKGEKPFETWPAAFLAAAANGESRIFDRMMSEPHDQFRLELLWRKLPSLKIFEKILRDDKSRAEPLLLEAANTERVRGLRPDLVSLALRYGANPDAEAHSSRTVLGEVSVGLSPESPQVVDLLLKAGADPNKLSWIDRPVWQPLGSMQLFPNDAQIQARALSIYQKLIRAGADLNLANGDGVPSLRAHLSPNRPAHTELFAHAGTPATMKMLVKDGLNINAQWNGERILSLVEKQAGKNSQLAIALRQLGAKP
jgi:hypothetical protein